MAHFFMDFSKSFILDTYPNASKAFQMDVNIMLSATRKFYRREQINIFECSEKRMCASFPLLK